MRPVLVITVAGLVLAAGVGAGWACRHARADTPSQTSSTNRGRQYLAQWGCGSCHMIPGIRSAAGVVAPPLTAFARRSFIAGEVPNNVENLVRWLVNPQSIEPGTAMPNLGISEPVARDMAAYLYSLR
jgi:cytochrome c1